MFDGLDHSVQALYVAPLDLVRWADRIRGHLSRMADGSGGRYETRDLFAALASGQMLLWIALDGAEIVCVMLTQIMDYPHLRAMRCIGVSGYRPRRWTHLMENVKRMSRDQFGCQRMEALHDPRHGVLLGKEWRQFHILSEASL